MPESFVTMMTDAEGGDFVHEGKSPKGELCGRGRIVQSISDDERLTYRCRKCGRSWRGEKLEASKAGPTWSTPPSLPGF